MKRSKRRFQLKKRARSRAPRKHVDKSADNERNEAKKATSELAKTAVEENGSADESKSGPTVKRSKRLQLKKRARSRAPRKRVAKSADNERNEATKATSELSQAAAEENGSADEPKSGPIVKSSKRPPRKKRAAFWSRRRAPKKRVAKPVESSETKKAENELPMQPAHSMSLRCRLTKRTVAEKVNYRSPSPKVVRRRKAKEVPSRSPSPGIGGFHKPTAADEDAERFKEFAADVEAILDEKTRFVKGTRQEMVVVQWKCTFEPFYRMKNDFPEIYKEYEVRKSTRIVSIVGKAGNATRVRESLKFNVETCGERLVLGYNEVREKYSDALIDFYLKKAEYDEESGSSEGEDSAECH